MATEGRWVRDESNAIGGWLRWLTFALGQMTMNKSYQIPRAAAAGAAGVLSLSCGLWGYLSPAGRGGIIINVTPEYGWGPADTILLGMLLSLLAIGLCFRAWRAEPRVAALVVTVPTLAATAVSLLWFVRLIS